MKNEWNDLNHQRLRLSLDSIALLLYCSEFYDCDELPMSVTEWNDLEKMLRASQLKRPAALLALEYEAIMINLDIDEELAYKIASRNKGIAFLLEQLQRLESLGVLVTTKYEEEYPYLLKRKMKKNMPLILYYSGDITMLKDPLVCVAGPIRSNRRIDQNTRAVISKLNEEAYTLISCGNRGVETLAMKHQLRIGGKAVNFLCGNIIIEMKEYLRPIKNGQMLLVSAVYPFANFDLVHAIDRNQYVFSLSEVAIIMYSQINSGAVWLSAMQNFTQRWTKLAAIMDDEFYGNARLIELGAIGLTMDMIQSPLTLSELLDQEEEKIKETESYDQISIYEFLGEQDEI